MQGGAQRQQMMMPTANKSMVEQSTKLHCGYQQRAFSGIYLLICVLDFLPRARH